MATRSVNGVDALSRVLWVMGMARSALRLNRIAVLSGVPKAEVRYLLQRLMEQGIVEQTEFGYVLNGDRYRVFGRVVFVDLGDQVLVVYPQVVGVDREEVFKAILEHLPPSVKSWIVGVRGVEHDKVPLPEPNCC